MQLLKKCVSYLLEEIGPPKPSGIIYEHEMVLPEIQESIVIRAAAIVVLIYMFYVFIYVITELTFVEMALALFFGSFYYVLIKHYRFGLRGILLVLVPLTIITTTLTSPTVMGPVIVVPLVIMLVLLNLQSFFNNRAKIRLIITHTNLLIRAPRHYHTPFVYGSVLNFVHLEFPLRDIRSISVKNTSDPSLEEIIHSSEGYKIVPNEKINSSHHPYQYVFALSNPNRNLQFIDLEPWNQGRILIEFDDARNFLRVLEERMPGSGKIT